MSIENPTKENRFWQRVHEAWTADFVELSIAPTSGGQAVQFRWSTPAVNKFVSVPARVCGGRPWLGRRAIYSRDSDGVLKRKNSRFKFQSCWEILKGRPIWSSSLGRIRIRNPPTKKTARVTAKSSEETLNVNHVS